MVLTGHNSYMGVDETKEFISGNEAER
jgi:hypothetical protein